MAEFASRLEFFLGAPLEDRTGLLGPYDLDLIQTGSFWVMSETGMRAGPGSSGKTILEAFKPGTAPPDNYSVIGVADANGREPQPLPDADRSLFRPGTGGLY